MKFHIITIFPEAFRSYFNCSILKKARDIGAFEPVFYKLNDFSTKPTKRVDDRIYGGLPGQLLSPEPLHKAITLIREKEGKDLKVVYMSPRGEKLTHCISSKYANNGEDLILICGHYEGIDARIIEIFNVIELSIGDYIISSGELSSMVFIDSVVRLLPDVLGSSDSLNEESFSEGLNGGIEYPQFTRPSEFMGLNIPSVLLSGNPKEIEKWKKSEIKSKKIRQMNYFS